MIEKEERLNTENKLLALLGERMSAFGFKPKPTEQSFYRAVATGKWAFHVSFIPHMTDLDLTADIAVRVNAIEDLVNEYDTKLTAGEKRKSMTLGGELGNISMGSPKRWTISTVQDIASVCDDVIESFQEIGLPFLQRHSDATAAHHVLISSNPTDLHLAPILGPRYMRAVASAYVTGHADEIEVLARKYETKLLATEDLYLEDFQTLSRSLLSRIHR